MAMAGLQRRTNKKRANAFDNRYGSTCHGRSMLSLLSTHTQPMPRTSCATENSVASHSLAHGQDEAFGRRRTRIAEACVLTCHCCLMKHDATNAAQSCPCKICNAPFSRVSIYVESAPVKSFATA